MKENRNIKDQDFNLHLNYSERIENDQFKKKFFEKFYYQNVFSSIFLLKVNNLFKFIIKIYLKMSKIKNQNTNKFLIFILY